MGAVAGRRKGGRTAAARARVSAAGRRLELNPKLVTTAKLVRELLPGDSQYGDPLSTAGPQQAQLVARRLSELTAERPGLLREAGLSALQVWQSVSEAQGRGRGDQEVTIVFTDLSGFSDWALEAGDDRALELLREVGRAIEPAMREHDGEVIKRLGDGLMVVFDEPQPALTAILEGRERLEEVGAEDYRPQLRAGIHVGRPRRLGGDYLGVDVNIAARLVEQASGDELLVSGRTLEMLDTEDMKVRRKRRFKVKGVPDDVAAHSVSG